jgi:hypothetical protein
LKPPSYIQPPGAFADFDRPKWWFKAREEVNRRAKQQDIAPTAVEEMFFGHIATRTELYESMKRFNAVLKETYRDTKLSALYAESPFFAYIRKEPA